VHAVPGPGIIKALTTEAKKIEKPRGGLLLVEMSSAGNLCTPDYQKGALPMARDYKDFIVGFIAMRPVEEGFLTLTPGVQIGSKGDSLGQTYRDPRDVVREGSDIIIVGRGITGAKDVVATATTYQELGWKGYLDRIGS
jgi:orotidine-5'-phosphate decarboxylase